MVKSYLDKMMANPEFQNGIESTEKLKDTIDEIDKILIPHYYLANDNIQKKWWEVRYSLKSANDPNLFKKFKEHVEKMIICLEEIEFLLKY
jgi:hypothetical protein